MQKRRICILGAGISGLSLAWYLQQKDPNIEVVICEKSARTGGWLETQSAGDFLFEKGPRTFKVSRCKELLDLISEIGLQTDVIYSNEKASSRYLWFKNKLQKLPENPIAFLTSPLTRGLLPGMFREAFAAAKTDSQDESVWDFIARRFNASIAERLFEPLILGIYAGDIRSLSVEACFPRLKAWEMKYGSITKGFFAQTFEQRKKNNQEKKASSAGSLFSFKEGMETLPRTLEKKLKAQILLNHEIHSLEIKGDKILVKSGNGIIQADHVFSTLPVQAMRSITAGLGGLWTDSFKTFHANDITVVHMGYALDVLENKGFGYLVPSIENEKVLGVVFDSCIFPQQNRLPKETRLALMMRGSGRTEQDVIKIALQTVRRHLKVDCMPEYIQSFQFPFAIPQYQVGHRKKIDSINNFLNTECPKLTWIGNAVGGVSVNDCVVQAKNLINKFLN